MAKFDLLSANRPFRARLILLFWIAASSFLDSTSSALAQAPREKPDVVAPIEDKNEPAVEQEPGVDGMLKSLGLKPLAAGSRLAEAVDRMRSAQQRIEKSDTGKGTQELQVQIVNDLDALIAELKRQQRRSRQNSSSRDQPQPEEKPGSQKATEEKRQQQPQNASKQPQEGTENDIQRARDRDQARESSDELREKRSQDPEASHRAQLRKDAWGHLPPAVRMQLLNVYSEKFLPQYEQLIQRYYEALAEQSKRQAP